MKTCNVCDDLLGPLAPGELQHRFCRWATPEDWRALAPWLTGTLKGVTMAGA